MATNDETTSGISYDSTPSEDVHTADNAQACTKPCCDFAGFSPDQVELLQTWFENDYDIYTDSDCVAWLHTFHPESAPPLATIYASVAPLQSKSPLQILHYLIVVP